MKDAFVNPTSNYEIHLLVTTNYGYSMVYHDIKRRHFDEVTLLPLLKNKHDLAAACEVLDFDLEAEKQNFNIILGLYSQYLVRYKEREMPIEAGYESYPGFYISDVLLLDYPIKAISKGDLFNIGISYMIVVTSRSVWVVGPQSINNVISRIRNHTGHSMGH